ncbi:MAG: hypothetical protein RL588_2565 [Pseudomonadota bacterium]|jgi:hypothetical protein
MSGEPAAPPSAAEVVADALKRRAPAGRGLFLRQLMAHALAGLTLMEGADAASEAAYRLADAAASPRRTA